MQSNNGSCYNKIALKEMLENAELYTYLVSTVNEACNINKNIKFKYNRTYCVKAIQHVLQKT